MSIGSRSIMRGVMLVISFAVVLLSLSRSGPSTAQSGAADLYSPCPPLPGTIVGTVTESTQGTPLPYCNVVLLGTTIGGITLDDGTYAFDVWPGDYIVQATYIGYTSDLDTVSVAAGDTVRADFVLEPYAFECELIETTASPLILKQRADTHQQVRSETFKQLPVGDVNEAIALKAGITSQGGELHFRGGRGGEVSTYVDGVPVNDPLARLGLRLSTVPTREAEATLGEIVAPYGNAQSGVETGGAQVRPLAHRPDLLSIRHDELWVIERPPRRPSRPPFMSHRDYPRCGALTARLVRTDADGNPLAEPEEVPIPLQHTAVDARVTAYIATVVVEQQFANPFDHTIEAIYHFPLPQNAAIDEFVMRIGERSIRGIIRDRDEAERIYREARARGHVASLLTQERPNIFTQAVANIEPGKQIDIEIHYVHTLAYKDGWYEYVFPMVVGPRFNPPGSADPIAAVPRRASRTTPSPAGDDRPGTQIEYLHPTERSGHDITVNLEIDAGVVIEELECVNHVVDVERETPGRARITLSPHDRIPNQDFVMRYRVTGETVKSALFTHQDERGGFLTMILYPPAAMSSLPRAPVEMVFLIDRSGSMQGAPMGKVRRALTRALRGLDARDTFQIVTFANDATACFPTAVPVTEENVRTGLAYIEQLTGGGGTMMVNGFRRALDVPPDPERLRLVSFMTDGKISNEVEVMQVAYEQLGNGRIFSFGVGSSPNRFLLDGLARIGNGAVAYVGLDENAGRAVDRFYERIRFPALTDITFDWGSWQVSDVYPSRIPDLFLGRAVIVTGRFEPGDGLAPGSIGVMGYQGGEVREIRVACDLGARQTHPGIASVWARRRIKDLEDSAVRATSHDQIVECESTIKDFALEYGLVSRFTAFIAVDSQSQTGPAQPVAMVVPVPVPEGVLYETTVTGGRCQH